MENQPSFRGNSNIRAVMKVLWLWVRHAKGNRKLAGISRVPYTTVGLCVDWLETIALFL